MEILGQTLKNINSDIVRIRNGYGYKKRATSQILDIGANAEVSLIDLTFSNKHFSLLSPAIANLDYQPLFMYHGLSNWSAVRSF
jgi:hypothetical protein